MGWVDMHQAITMAYQLSAKWISQLAITISIQAIDHGLSAINQILNHTKNTHSPVQILNSPTIPIS